MSDRILNIIIIVYLSIIYYFVFSFISAVNLSQKVSFLSKANCDISKHLKQGDVVIKDISEINIYSLDGKNIVTKNFLQPTTVKLVINKNLYSYEKQYFLQIKPLCVKDDE